jgi:hypothetical protein
MLLSPFGKTKRYATRPAFKQHAHMRIQPRNQRKPDWVRNELIRLAAVSRGSRRSVARLFNRLHGERYGETVSVSFTCDFLKRHAVQVLRLRRELAAKPPRAVPICHTWAMYMDSHFFASKNASDFNISTTANVYPVFKEVFSILLTIMIIRMCNSHWIFGFKKPHGPSEFYTLVLPVVHQPFASNRVDSHLKIGFQKPC